MTRPETTGPETTGPETTGPETAGPDSGPRRGPVDPRLWRYSRAARGYLLVTVAAGAVTAGMVIVSALMIGTVLAGVITDPATRTVDAWRWQIAVLAGAVLVRTAASWARSRYSHRAALRVVGDVRAHVLAAAVDAEPRALASRREDLATVVTRGLDALRPYLTGYLPALGLAITVTPAALAVIAWQDLTSAVIIAVTLPLVPIFMILIGLLTRGASQRRLRTMSVLSAQLLDLIAGLPTLRALGRQRGPEARVRKLGEDHRIAAMATLRWAFLSSMVLELLATLCVALVAVSIGLRLVYGDMSLSAGLIALVLAPEVYAPLRAVGVQFHAAEDGVAASDSAFRACEELRDRATPAPTPPPPLPGAGGASQALARPVTVRLDGVSVRGRSNLAPCGLDAEFRPGRITALAGANGAGKTTALHAILGLQVPDEGQVQIAAGGRHHDISAIDLDAWWSHVAWLAQRPVLIPGTLRENIDFARRGAGGTAGSRSGPGADSEIMSVARETGFADVLEGLPDGLETMLAVRGEGLSLGERQRLALTRTLMSEAPVLILDEPTAHLDEATAARVLAALRARADAGDTVIVVGHRPSVLAAADEVIEVHAGAGSGRKAEIRARELHRQERDHALA